MENPEWLPLLEAPPMPNLIHNLHIVVQTTLDMDLDPLQSEDKRHLVTQLEIMDVRLLPTRPKRLYGMVFTNGKVAVSERQFYV